jgi:hypothetical protein
MLKERAEDYGRTGIRHARARRHRDHRRHDPFGTKIELHGADFLRERLMPGSSMGSNRFRVDMPRRVEFS